MLYIIRRPDDPLLLAAVEEHLAQGLGPKADASRADWSALHWFAASNSSDPVSAQAWVAAGGDPNAQSDNQDTALHVAAWRGNIDKCRFLLDLGANPSIPNHKGHTPLHHALRKKNAELACLLGRAGADWDLADMEGKSGLSYAVDLLVEHLAWDERLPPGSPEQDLLDTIAALPLEYWGRPYSHQSPYLTVMGEMERHPRLAPLGAGIVGQRMEQELPPSGPGAPRRPASRF